MYRIPVLFIAALLLASATIAQPVDSAVFKKQLYEKCKQEYNDFEKAHGHFIETPNVRMHYVTWGKPKDKPIIWIHGTNGNAYENIGLADSLVKAGYYFIAIDYYGHGLTPIPAKEVSLFHIADDIKVLMDDLRIRRAVIGGFSRGGSIATAFYDAYPEAVHALILEDGGSVTWNVNSHKKPVDSLVAEIERDYKNRQGPRVYNDELELFTRIYNRNGTRPAFKRILFTFLCAAKPTDSGKLVLNPGLADFLSEGSSEQLLRAIHRPYAATLFGASTNLLYPKIIYRNLDVPMLIFDPVGDGDVFDFREGNEQLQQAHPKWVTHKVYENTGHAVKFDRPTEFTRDVLAFLAGVNKK